jgi:hypothetical protein
MWQLMLAAENKVFSIALALMLLIAVVELVAVVLGGGLSASLDSMLPDPEVTQPETEGVLSRLLSWLRIGEVPLLMVLVVFLMGFSLIGLFSQKLLMAMFGFYSPGWLAGLYVLPLSLPFVRWGTGVLQRVIPKDETTAITAESLIGRVALITLGTAKAGYPAEAKVKDQHNYYHYIQVEPDEIGQEFVTGTEILLLSRQGNVYKGILNLNPHLSERQSDLN